MDAPCFVRRKKSAAERRAQRHRSEARFLQRALNGLNDVHAHRGGTLTRFGWALRESLSRFSSGTEVPPSTSFVPSVPGHSPHSDAVSAPFHGVPAEEPGFVALSSAASADPQGISVLPVPEVGEGVDEAIGMPMQFPEPSSSDVHVTALRVSIGSGNEPDVVLPQDVPEAVSVPADFWGVSEVAQPQCFLVLADVRSCGAASKFALVTVRPFFFMIRCGLPFMQAMHTVAPEAPSKEITPKFHDGTGGVKHDCNQQ